jgi:hypothetical protein
MLLENVQRRATKFILGYPENMNYKERLSNLGIMPLEYRREMADLILFFKFKPVSQDFRPPLNFRPPGGEIPRNIAPPGGRKS